MPGVQCQGLPRGGRRFGRVSPGRVHLGQRVEQIGVTAPRLSAVVRLCTASSCRPTAW